MAEGHPSEKRQAANPAAIDWDRPRDILACRWTVRHGDKIYGPYTCEAMETYIAEGRLAAHSMIAPEGSTDWRAATTVSIFSGLFDTIRAPHIGATVAPRPTAEGKRLSGETANFVIITEIKSRQTGPFGDDIMSIGAALKLSETVWLVSARATSIALVNHLSRNLDLRDRLVIIDAARDRIAWFNLATETAAKVARVWRKPA